MDGELDLNSNSYCRLSNIAEVSNNLKFYFTYEWAMSKQENIHSSRFFLKQQKISNQSRIVVAQGDFLVYIGSTTSILEYALGWSSVQCCNPHCVKLGVNFAIWYCIHVLQGSEIVSRSKRFSALDKARIDWSSNWIWQILPYSN